MKLTVAFVITRTASAATSLTSLSILITRLTDPFGIIKSPSTLGAAFLAPAGFLPAADVGVIATGAGVTPNAAFAAATSASLTFG